ncbi:MAG: flavodoxin [Pseudomonadota bacterium]
MLLIAFHSQSGTSAALARAAYEAARAEYERTSLLRCCDAGARDLGGATGFMLICAENSGRLAGGAKDLLDRCFYPLHERGHTIPYALMVSAGNDGRGAVEEARRIFRGIPFTEALEPRIIRGPVTPSSLGEAADLGAGFAAGLGMGIF